jgi:orotidine-5'-phosphate decarboxylase
MPSRRCNWSIGWALRSLSIVYKVGLELFAAEGPDIVRELIVRGKDVFVDLKMYDIGATVERATARVAGLGARFLTVHSSPQVIRAAHGDQKRVATPLEALRAGANYLVIGREVTRAADPRAAAGRILADLAGAL